MVLRAAKKVGERANGRAGGWGFGVGTESVPSDRLVSLLTVTFLPDSYASPCLYRQPPSRRSSRLSVLAPPLQETACTSSRRRASTTKTSSSRCAAGPSARPLPMPAPAPAAVAATPAGGCGPSRAASLGWFAWPPAGAGGGWVRLAAAALGPWPAAAGAGLWGGGSRMYMLRSWSTLASLTKLGAHTRARA